MTAQRDRSLSITRIANACVLIEIGDDKILTDPFFSRQFYGISELPALDVEDLPPLTAIIGGHSVPDHWQIKLMSSYPYKSETPVYVSTKSMAKKAIDAGFEHVELLVWGDNRQLSEGLILETLKGHRSLGLTINNYVLRGENVSAFFGSETRDLEPLRDYAIDRPNVDVVLAPVNAVHLFGVYKLVMSGVDAIEATRILGADVFFSIHDAHEDIPFVVNVKSSAAEAEAEARLNSDIKVVRMPVGKKWTQEVDD